MNKTVTLAESRQNALAILNTIRSASPETKCALMTMNPVVAGTAGGNARAALAAYCQVYRDMVAADPSLLLIDNALSWAGVGLAEIPDGLHPLLAQVYQRQIPDMVAVIAPLIS